MTQRQLQVLKKKYLREGYKMGLRESINFDRYEAKKEQLELHKDEIDDEFVKIVRSNIINTLRKMTPEEDGSFDGNLFVNEAIISRGLLTKLSRSYDSDSLDKGAIVDVVIDILSSKRIRFSVDGYIDEPMSIEEVADFYADYLLESLYERQYS